MTKQVRIENADTNTSVKVVVIVQDKEFKQDENGMWYETGNWTDVERRELNSPADLATGLYLTTSRRIVVTEESATS